MKKLQERLGKELRDIHDEIANEPIPERFRHLLDDDDPPPRGDASGAGRPIVWQRLKLVSRKAR